LQHLLGVLEQLVLLEPFDELRSGLDFSCRYPYTEQKRFVRIDIHSAPVGSKLGLCFVSCTGYFAGLCIAAM
jgi:hypothetical protein